MKKRVLVVDDDPDILDGLRALLEDTYDVLVSANGREALDLIAREPVDALLLDLMMPGVNGEAVLRELAQRPAAPPAIVLSARADGDDVARALGAMAYLTKPFEVERLEETLARVIAGGGGGGGPGALPPGAPPPPEGGRPPASPPAPPGARALRAA